MQTPSEILTNLMLILPEVLLVLALAGLIIYDLFLPRAETKRAVIVAIAALAAASALLIVEIAGLAGAGGAGAAAQPAFANLLAMDTFAAFFRLMFVLSAAVVLLFSLASRELDGYRLGEYANLLLCATLGMMFLASAQNFLMLYLALETLSLGSYALAGFSKRNRLSTESALKYLIFGAVASGIMLFGLSYLYGLTGSLQYADIFMPGRPLSFAVQMSVLLVLAGFAFKIAAVPFHFWAPDVYQGAPTPITAFLAVGSKAAGVAMLLRFFGPYFFSQEISGVKIFEAAPSLPAIFWILAAATMTLGNLVALRQWDIKRLLAYSSIAHAGYMLMGFTVAQGAAMQAIIMYLVAYFFMNLGAFLVAIVMINATGSADIRRWRGAIGRLPLAAVLMAVFLFSLTGIPPTVGFAGKLMIFKVVIEAGLQGEALHFWFYISLALIGGLNTVISLYYYVKVLKAMIIEPEEKLSPMIGARLAPAMGALLLVFGVPVVVLGIYFGPLIRLALAATNMLG